MRFVNLIILGALCAPSIVFCQQKNSFSFQTGIIHCFFDDSPLMNTKYPSKAIKPFNGVLINSVGLSYQRKLNSKSAISLDFMHFFEGYTKTYREHKKNQIGERLFNTATLNYNRFFSLEEKINLVYGVGLDYRFGQENVVVNYGYFPSLDLYEPLIEVTKRNDLGVNILGGIEYSPLNWLTLYSKLDLLSFVYMTDKQAYQKLNNDYGMNNYPNRFDLSLKIGIGFNF